MYNIFNIIGIKMNFTEFGKNIARLRKQQNISQTTLANDIGISRATLSSFENGGVVDIGFKKVLQIVEYLGYELDLKLSSPFPTFEELRDERQFRCKCFRQVCWKINLSGVQPKVLANIEDKATLKCNDYIIKSWGYEYPQLALNEYYCMKKDITDIKLAPAYDVISTTAYIKNDISALHLMGSKKWWAKKHILKFGIDSCCFTKSEVNKLYDECLKATQKVSVEIENRLKNEKDKTKIEILKHIYTTIQNKT